MLNLELKGKNSKNGIISVEIENQSPDPIMISGDVILLDGFTSDKFKIIDKASNESLVYLGQLVKYKPQKIELNEHQKLISELNLKDAYNLEDCHEYQVIFKTIAIVGHDIFHLSGEISINIGECN